MACHIESYLLIHAIRKLARQVHRRSVWQVLALYLLLGWVGLEAVQFATARVGLPGWTPTMALVLIAVGLPIALATAVAQNGLPWLRIEDFVDPNELEGLTPEQVHVVPQAHPMYGEGVLTWRNAVLLGVMSLALLVTSVVAYLTMWALGIGPVGSLVAQGVIGEDDVVLVAEFDNRTDEIALGDMVRDAFETDLAQSELVSVFGAQDVARALRSMNRNPDEAVTASLARQLSQAEGIAALIEGEVARFGGGYRISVRIVVLPRTSPLSQFRETVGDRAGLVPAIDLLSERVRARFGESLRLIRAGTPLAELYGPTLTASGR